MGKTTVLKSVEPITQRSADLETMPILIEIVDGPLDGLVLASSESSLRLGRSLDNDLAVPEDLFVSGRHVEIRRTRDPRIFEVEDLGSSNKTWVDGEALVSAHRIQAGSPFVLGYQTVVRVSLPATAETTDQDFSMPDLGAERSRILAKLASHANSALGAAAMLAGNEGRGYLNERDLFLGLAMTEADQSLLARGRGPIDQDMLLEFQWRPNTWDEAPWIAEHQAKGRELERFKKFFAYQRVWTPRLLQLMQGAEAAARERGRSRIEITDLVRVLVQTPESQVHRWLVGRGRKIEILLQMLDQTPSGAASVLEPADQTLSSRGGGLAASELGPATEGRRGTNSLYLDAAFTSGDRTLDNRAQDTGRQLYGFAALYQFAEPQERRQGMQKLIEETMATIPADKRRQWLEQLRRMFPLDRGSTDASEEVERLHRVLQQLKARVHELEGELSGLGGSLPWQMVLDERADLDALTPAERPRIELVREVFHFGQHLEKAIVGMVQDLLSGVGQSTSLHLPGHRITLGARISDIESGQQVRLDDLRDYLMDLRRWFTVAMVAYEKAPGEWFKEFWQNHSPRSIEAAAEGPFARIGTSLWNRYKDAARRISPDIAAQHIRRKTQEIAKTKHREYFSEGRS